MDGNRRWAHQRGMSSVAGHRAGADALGVIAAAATREGVKWMTVFAFSTENWQRAPAEVSGLLRLIGNFIKTQSGKLMENNVRLRVVGRRDQLSQYLQGLIQGLESRSAYNTGLNLTVALDYGGQHDIVAAVTKIGQEIERGLLTAQDITDDLVKSRLLTNVLPAVDLLIRTGGEKRISNFMLWDLSYAELYFTDQFWPDFGTVDFERALAEYRRRDRRFGGTNFQSTPLRVVKSDNS
jgi:undecaprenyl diphosphate synthase